MHSAEKKAGPGTCHKSGGSRSIVAVLLAVLAAGVGVWAMVSRAQTLAEARLRIEEFPLVAPGSMPRHGTFWSMQFTNSPPLPYNPFPGLSLSYIGGNSYMIWDLEVDYPAFYQQLKWERAMRRMERQYGLASLAGESLFPEELLLGDDMEMESMGLMAAYDFPAGSFYLEIYAVTTNASLILRGTSSESVYALLSATGLTNSAWETEQTLRGAVGQDWTETSIAVGNRSNGLFFRGMIWSTNDQAGEAISVSLTNPAGGAYFGQWPTNIAMEASATASADAIQGVAFYSGASLLSWDSTAPYTYAWTNVGRGRYSLRARAFDSLGGSKTSEPVQISVDPCYDAVDVVLVVDRSSSMAGQRFTNALAACSNFVSFLSFPADQVGLVSFDSNPVVNLILTNNQASVLDGIGHISPPGRGTMMSNAIHQARLELISSGHNTNALAAMVFLSDGAPNDNPTNILAEADRAKTENNIRIFTVGIGADNRALMEKIATSTNDYFYSANSSDLTALFAAVATKLCRSNAAPDVYISIPTNNTVLSLGNPITLQAHATDADGVVVGVQFWETNLLGAVQSASNSYYTFAWSSPAHVGSNVLRAVATDNAGLSQTSSPVTIRLIAPPRVQWLTPTNSASYPLGAAIALSADARQTDGASITNVEFRAGTNFVGSATSGSSNIFSVTWTNPPSGTHGLTAIASDSDGLRTTSSPPVQVSVSLAVAITRPASNTVFVAPAVISMSAEVTPGTGVRYVKFATNQAAGEIGRDSLSTTNPYQAMWAGVPEGQYLLYARAANQAGGLGASAPVPIRVIPRVSVDPGANQTLVLTNGVAVALLAGGISGGDGVVTSVWEQITGPLPGGMTNATSTNAWGTFTNAGNYTFRLTAGDAHSGACGVMTVYVAENQPPVVDAGPNVIVNSTNASVVLRGSAVDDGLPAPALGVRWSVLEPPDAPLAFADANALETAVGGFPSNSVYRLRLSAWDGLATNHSEVIVSVVPAGSRTWTLNADFAEGALINVNFDAVAHQLQLNETITPFPYVWVACTARGTIVKIDANTGQILGEYRTAPSTIPGPSPSRTTVDLRGNVWVANRYDNLEVPGTNVAMGSITRVAIVVGGIRGIKEPADAITNYTFTPSPDGEWLSPPFLYCTATDRDGDKLIRTSHGLGNILDWDPTATETNDWGGISAALDECIINYTRVAPTGTRTIAVDSNNDIWVGGHPDHAHQKISGTTGVPIENTFFVATNGGYGGLIDGNGMLWTAGDLTAFDPAQRFDFNTTPPQVLNDGYTGTVLTNNYGVGIDPHSGDVWCTTYGTGENFLGVFVPGAPPVLRNLYTDGVVSSKGIALDGRGNVWVAHGEGTTTIGHFRTNGVFVGNVALGCTNLSPSGVAVDSNGKVWVTCRGQAVGDVFQHGTVVRVDPGRGEAGAGEHLIGELDMVVSLDIERDGSPDIWADPYNYSDMTGLVSLGATSRSGSWTVVHDGRTNDLAWGAVGWNGDVPDGATLRVEARAANDLLLLAAATNTYRKLTNGLPMSEVQGRYVEIRATLSRATNGLAGSPILYDLTLSTGPQAIPAAIAALCADDHATALPETPVLIDVLKNDLPPVGEGVGLSSVSPPACGSATITNTGGRQLIRYVADRGFHGVDRFSYTVGNESNVVGRALVAVDVGPSLPLHYAGTGAAPAANDDTNHVPAGSLRWPLFPLANDLDWAGSPVELSSFTQAQHGTVAFESCGLFYTPNPGYFGPDSFTYTIVNTQRLAATASVCLRVTGVPLGIVCGQTITNRLDWTNVAVARFDAAAHANSYVFPGDPSALVTFELGGLLGGSVLMLHTPEGQQINMLNNANGFIARSTNLHLIEVGVYNLAGYAESGYELAMSCAPTNAAQMELYLGERNLPHGSTLVYPATQVGTPVPASLVISNLGSTNLLIDVCFLEDPVNFQIEGALTNYAIPPHCIAPGGFTNLLVHFLAAGSGSTNGQLWINSNDPATPTRSLHLTGLANPGDAQAPSVQFNSPVDGAQLAFPADVALSATAICQPTSSIWGVTFFMVSSTGHVAVAQALAGAGVSNFTATATWARPGPGRYTLLARAYDVSGLAGETTNQTLSIMGFPGIETNAPPVAREDTLMLQASVSNRVTYPIEVLANDSDPNGDPLTLAGFTYRGEMGSVARDGSRLLFTLEPLWHGTNYIHYTISDGKGGTSGNWVNIFVRKANLPTVELITPQDGEYIELQTTNLATRSLPLAACALSTNPTGSIARVSFYDQDQLLGSTAGNVSNIFTFNWETPVSGEHYITAVALDDVGQENLTEPAYIRIAGKPGNVLPAAAITNLAAILTNDLNTAVYPIVTNGFIDVLGRAADEDDPTFWHQVLLYKADGSLVANLTPNPGSNGYRASGDDGGSLVTNVDLTLYENGVYDLVLNVFDGWDVSSDTARILLDSQLKIGQFSFSVEDLTIPVGGMPLTVVRTYNSFNRGQGDFGHSWTYAIHDVNLEIDEIREETAEVSGDDAGGGKFSLRVGGGRDVTLNLPNGRRVTFQCYFDGPRSCGYDNDPYCYFARWKAPPGVFAKLTPLGGDLSYNALTRKWSADGMSGFETFDIPGFILETQDGTQYTIEREDLEEHFFLSGYNDDFYVHTYGKGRLTQVEQLDQNKIVIGPDIVQHFDAANQPTRALRFARDEQGRITAIYDPVSDVSTPRRPVLRYHYDPQTGNLTGVDKLRDRTIGDYDLTTYEYTNRYYPHYLTGIIDPRGIMVARTEYEDDGRIKAVIDADGKTNRVYHDLSGKLEITVDRMGRTNCFAYDLRGNVVAATNAAGGIKVMEYDRNNLRTNEVLFLAGQPYATNRALYSAEGFLLTNSDALGHSNVFTHNQYGQVTTNLDARGNGATNYFDERGNVTGSVDALGNAITNVYNSLGLLTLSRNAKGTITEYAHDGFGNQTASWSSDATGLLATNLSFYDVNNNRTSSIAWFRIGGTWKGATNTYVFDGHNRMVQTINGAGTNIVAFTSFGQQDYTIDKLGRVTSFEYDSQARLRRTIHPDLTSETSDCDWNGNRTNSLDRAARSTRYVFDELGRITQTVLADNTTNRTGLDQLGRMRFSVDARGVTNAFGYDRAGRRTAVTNAWGTLQQAVQHFGFDENGNQIWSLDPSGLGVTNVFDKLNRLVETRYADGTRTSTGFDADGLRVAETNQDCIVSLFGFDGAGRLLSVTNALGTTNQTVTRYEWDEAGNQTAQIDALNRTNRFEYNLLSQRVAHWMPDGTNVERFAYDAVGNLVLHTNFNGAVITNAYDEMNRLTNRRSAEGYSVSFAHTPTGQRRSMSDPSGTTSYFYDLRDRLRQKVVAWVGGPEISLDYRRDASGNLTNVWSSTDGGVNLAYAFDALHRITNALSGGSLLASYAYTTNGSLAVTRYAIGVTNLYQYNALSQLTNLVWKSNDTVLASFAYQLGATGNRTNLNETVNGVSQSYSWTYDNLYRLTSETITGMGVLTYAHDDVGNRTNRWSSMMGVSPTTNSYSANDWLSTDAYDNNGNTLRSTNGPAFGPFEYDVDDRLIGISNGAVQFVFNGDGMRVAKRYVSTVGGLGNFTNTIYYLLDDQNPTGYAQVLEEHQGSAVRIFRSGLALIAQREPNGTEYFFISDGHGSTRMLLSADGAVANAFSYDAYGMLISSNAPPQTDFLYSGEQCDRDLCSYNSRARFYNPNTGRFWTKDRYEGEVEAPASLHKYSWCRADPVNRVDPSGLADYKLVLVYEGAGWGDPEFYAQMGYETMYGVADRLPARGGTKNTILISPVRANDNIYQLVQGNIDASHLVQGTDHITKVVIAGHGRPGWLGALQGGPSTITSASLEGKEPTPQKQMLAALKPFTQGNCIVRLQACYQAKEEGKGMMKLIAVGLGAKVTGWDDQYAVWGWGNQWTVDPEGNWTEKKGQTFEDGWLKGSMDYLGELGWDYIGL